jgi:hypothetical protein
MTSPSEITPARAACEAFWGTIRHLPGEDQGPGAAWRWAQSQNTEGAWEAAATAGYEAIQRIPAEVPEGQAMLLRPPRNGTVVIAARTTIPESAREQMRSALRRDGLSVVFAETVDAIAAIPPGPPGDLVRDLDEARSLIAEILGMAEGQLDGRTHIRRGEITEWRERAGFGEVTP